MLKHSTVASLKQHQPKLASLLSRLYALVAASKNASIAARAETRPLRDVEFWSILRQARISCDQLVECVMEGDVILARGLIQNLGLKDAFDSVFRRGYGLGWDEMEDIHKELNAEDILDKTEALKNDAELLGYACTIVQSLFANEPELYAELMPNLRPHVPYATMRDREEEIERRLGRGKMNPHGPHKDSWRYHPSNTINVWLAMTNVVPLNGMFLLPKSADYYPQFANNEIRIGCETYPDRQYLTEMQAGDAVIFLAELLHGSILNQVDKTRFAFSLRCATEQPKFHKHFMYNYVRLKPSFSNLSFPKLVSRNDFEPPSRDRYSESLGQEAPHLNIASMDQHEIVVRIGSELHTYPRRCPHQNMDLRHGYLDRDKLVCPQHQMRICEVMARKIAAE